MKTITLPFGKKVALWVETTCKHLLQLTAIKNCRDFPSYGWPTDITLGVDTPIPPPPIIFT